METYDSIANVFGVDGPKPTLAGELPRHLEKLCDGPLATGLKLWNERGCSGRRAPMIDSLLAPAAKKRVGRLYDDTVARRRLNSQSARSHLEPR